MDTAKIYIGMKRKTMDSDIHIRASDVPHESAWIPLRYIKRKTKEIKMMEQMQTLKL